MSDDELISAYADGTLQGAERAAFEARLAREADLQRKVAATQLLLREAPALRVSMVPRNFILPASATARSPRPRAAQPWALRLAAALALFLFVSLLVLESALQPLSQTPAGMPAMPMAAEPMQEAAPQSEPAGQRMLPQALPADITAIPMPTEPTPEALAAPSAEQPSSPQSLFTPLRLLAGLALVLALVLIWLGRSRRV